MGKSKKKDKKNNRTGTGTGASSTTNVNNIEVNPYKTDPGKKKPDSAVRLVILSDTHGKPVNPTLLPEADILVFCGDHSLNGEMDESMTFINSFLRVHESKYEHVVLIAGNHDEVLDPSLPEHDEGKKTRILSELRDLNCVYLEDQDVILKWIKFYGSPW